MSVCRYLKGIILYRVPEFLSSRLNWVPPPPPRKRACLPPPPSIGSWGDTLACGEGVGDDWTETLVLYIVKSLYVDTRAGKRSLALLFSIPNMQSTLRLWSQTKKYNAFLLMGLFSLLLANTGKASDSHLQRRNTKREEREEVSLLIFVTR
jgi:hypothetical protein